jgi:hypothetical protein
MKRLLILGLLSIPLAVGCVAQGGQSVNGPAEGGKVTTNITLPVTVTQVQSGYGRVCYNPMNRAPMCMLYQPGYQGSPCFCQGPWGPVNGVIGP